MTKEGPEQSESTKKGESDIVSSKEMTEILHQRINQLVQPTMANWLLTERLSGN